MTLEVDVVGGIDVVLVLGLKVKMSVETFLHSGLFEPKKQSGFSGCFFVVY